MARHIPNEAYDAYFAYFSACTALHLVSDVETPTDLTNSLAVANLEVDDFTIDDGAPTGRKLIISTQESVSVTNPGTTRHAVLAHLDSTGPDVWSIRLVTTCSERVVSAADGDKVNMGSFYLQVAAPVAP